MVIFEKIKISWGEAYADNIERRGGSTMIKTRNKENKHNEMILMVCT
jgi:hypothetical protein